MPFPLWAIELAKKLAVSQAAKQTGESGSGALLSALLGGAEEAEAADLPKDTQAPTQAPPVPQDLSSFDQGDIMATPQGQVQRSFEPIPEDIRGRLKDVPSYTKESQLQRGGIRGFVDALSGQIRPKGKFAEASTGRKTAHALGGTLGDVLRGGLGAGSASNKAYQQAMAGYYQQGNPIVTAEGVPVLDAQGNPTYAPTKPFKQPREKAVTAKEKLEQDFSYAIEAVQAGENEEEVLKKLIERHKNQAAKITKDWYSYLATQ